MTDERKRVPDRRDGRGYVLHPKVAFAVRVATATGRPLLLRGEPGSGKSSLAAHIAYARGWRYYQHVVTSRTTARELLWSFDSVRRLADAQIRRGRARDDTAYVKPGVLWWAFDSRSARKLTPDPVAANEKLSGQPAVVLIDEIDKADPDMPNGMLVPLGSSEFEVTDTGASVRATDTTPPLIVITTNEDRELPQAFLRRCVVTWLPELTVDHLVDVAVSHLGLRERPDEVSDDDRELARHLAEELMKARDKAEDEGARPPSTAEYLDALRAIRELGITIGSDDWKDLRSLTLLKVQQPRR